MDRSCIKGILGIRGVSGNSRSREFPGITTSHSRPEGRECPAVFGVTNVRCDECHTIDNCSVDDMAGLIKLKLKVDTATESSSLFRVDCSVAIST